eukprot:gnl/Ergobibamus_cyprinoides/972.p1 GENE.gnl/Ergobibamus_cyprinoides/972~~gnl/Ergobibamus_cyprinoides/972.p1  ORF type:complete len:257 (-),score=38.51 gnl/Ergobibamus_cyprinoides/972:93-863(-)
MIVLPSLRPDLFQGLRAPPSRILLFGPPGTGKTLLARAIASSSGCNFFSVSASTLITKWVGDSEKLVRSLFAVARALSPSIVFLDEVDSILGSRSQHEMESSRRLKTQFMVELEGVGVGDDSGRVILMAATNFPQFLDSAVLRRFQRRILIPLPDADARFFMMRHLLKGVDHSVSDAQLHMLTTACEHYSGSDMNLAVKEAVWVPIRELGSSISDKSVKPRPVTAQDFVAAFQRVRPSLDATSHAELIDWAKQHSS